MYFKLGQACVKNWGSTVTLQIGEIVVTTWASLVIKKWGNWYYKIGTVITDLALRYYKMEQFLQIGSFLTNCSRHYTLW